MSHAGIPLDRRVVYAIELLGGLRTGECAALRWRHYDPSLEPLGSPYLHHVSARDNSTESATAFMSSSTVAH